MEQRFGTGSTALRRTVGVALCSLALAGCGSGHTPISTTTRPTSATTSPTIASACGAGVSDAYARAVLADSPVAYYRLNQISGPTMCDSSRLANNGTYEAGVQFGVTGAIVGNAAVEAGAPSSGIGTGGPGSGLVGDHSFTLEAWERDATAHNQSLVSMGQAGEGNVAGLSTWTSSAGDGQASQLVLDLYVGVENASALPIWNTSTVGVNLWDGNWHDVAVTYNAAIDKVTGYVDGHDMGALTPVTAIDLAASAVRVGYWVDDLLNPNVVGDEDEVAVYPSALSSSRIDAHYTASGAAVTPASTTTLPSNGAGLALGTDNPVPGDCVTNTVENATAVGFVTLTFTSSSFVADIHLQSGMPNTVYGVFMQQVPGSCPQMKFNGGTLTTNSKGGANFVATVPRVAGASTFFVQLVSESANSEYTSNRISSVS